MVERILNGCGRRLTNFSKSDNAFTGRHESSKFLQLAFKAFKDCKWHISMENFAQRVGINEDNASKCSGAVRLAYAMRYMLFKCVCKNQCAANKFQLIYQKNVCNCAPQQTKKV